MEEDNEKIFIVLAGTELNVFALALATESQITHSKKIIKLLEIDYECTGHEILELCYGIKEMQMRLSIGVTPSFSLPLKEIKDIKKFIEDKNSVIGHIKYCLKHCYETLAKNTNDIDVDCIRKESILNFRVSSPILF